MSGHFYKFTVEHQEGAKGNSVESAPLAFEIRHHEDIFKIVEMMKNKIDLNEEEATAFAVGLKLFSGTMMKNKDLEIFKQFKPHFGDFMKELKKG